MQRVTATKSKFIPAVQALAAALLFGASTPLAKLLLGSVQPLPLAALLYLGSGAGMLFMLLFSGKREAPLTRGDLPWLAGAAAFGGVAAPVILMFSLKSTPASTASLLLNFEAVATTLIALAAFREQIGKAVWIAIALMTASGILLSWQPPGGLGLSVGALGILAACFCWGLDNNFTRNISAKDPFSIVAVKGLASGATSLALTFATGGSLPRIEAAATAMLLGFLSYGLSIVLFVLALRSMGSARTGAYFATAPFMGSLLSFVILRDSPGLMFLISLPLMAAGSVLLLRDNHAHAHMHPHEVHEHRHSHDDGHHEHTHPGIQGAAPQKAHSHLHEHQGVEHDHPHMPDTAHRHPHAGSHRGG